MSSKKPPAWMEKAAKSKQAVVPVGKLEEIKKVVKEARDLGIVLADHTQKASDTKKKITDIEMRRLPDLMEGAGVPAITIDAEGNLPAFEAKSKPYYSAGIRSDWPQEDRERSFAYLKEIGHDELIKTEVSYAFPKDTSQAAIAQFMREVRKIKIGKGKRALSVPAPHVERGVNSNTLTAWLKDQVENEGFMPKLDMIGGFVGKKVTIKEVQEKKKPNGKPITE